MTKTIPTIAALTIALAAGLAVPTPAFADEGGVRIRLRSGETIEGTLVDFGERIYRVRIGAAIREIREAEVARIDLTAPPLVLTELLPSDEAIEGIAKRSSLMHLAGSDEELAELKAAWRAQDAALGDLVAGATAFLKVGFDTEDDLSVSALTFGDVAAASRYYDAILLEKVGRRSSRRRDTRIELFQSGAIVVTFAAERDATHAGRRIFRDAILAALRPRGLDRQNELPYERRLQPGMLEIPARFRDADDGEPERTDVAPGLLGLEQRRRTTWRRGAVVVDELTFGGARDARAALPKIAARVDGSARIVFCGRVVAVVEVVDPDGDDGLADRLVRWAEGELATCSDGLPVRPTVTARSIVDGGGDASTDEDERALVAARRIVEQLRTGDEALLGATAVGERGLPVVTVLSVEPFKLGPVARLPEPMLRALLRRAVGADARRWASARIEVVERSPLRDDMDGIASKAAYRVVLEELDRRGAVHQLYLTADGALCGIHVDEAYFESAIRGLEPVAALTLDGLVPPDSELDGLMAVARAQVIDDDEELNRFEKLAASFLVDASVLAGVEAAVMATFREPRPGRAHHSLLALEFASETSALRCWERIEERGDHPRQDVLRVGSQVVMISTVPIGSEIGRRRLRDWVRGRLALAGEVAHREVVGEGDEARPVELELLGAIPDAYLGEDASSDRSEPVRVLFGVEARHRVEHRLDGASVTVDVRWFASAEARAAALPKLGAIGAHGPDAVVLHGGRLAVVVEADGGLAGASLLGKVKEWVEAELDVSGDVRPAREMALDQVPGSAELEAERRAAIAAHEVHLSIVTWSPSLADRIDPAGVRVGEVEGAWTGRASELVSRAKLRAFLDSRDHARDPARFGPTFPVAGLPDDQPVPPELVGVAAYRTLVLDGRPCAVFLNADLEVVGLLTVDPFLAAIRAAEPPMATARIELPRGGAWSVDRRLEIDLSVEVASDGGGGFELEQKLTLETSQALAVRDAGTGVLAARLTGVRVTLDDPGAKRPEKRRRSWTHTKDPIELVLGVDAGGRLARVDRPDARSLQALLREAGAGEMRDVIFPYLFDGISKDSDGRPRLDGWALPTCGLPAERAARWSSVHRRLYGLVEGLENDFVLIAETWRWSVEDDEDGVLTVRGVLEKAVIDFDSPKRYHRFETSDVSGEATVRLDAKTGVGIALDATTRFAFVAGWEGRGDEARGRVARREVASANPAEAGSGGGGTRSEVSLRAAIAAFFAGEEEALDAMALPLSWGRENDQDDEVDRWASVGEAEVRKRLGYIGRDPARFGAVGVTSITPIERPDDAELAKRLPEGGLRADVGGFENPEHTMVIYADATGRIVAVVEVDR